jgi:UDP-N-acetylmuramyl tripeptide synthase
VLEIDEPYVPAIAAAAHPRIVTLLNLSRESTRGVVLRDLQIRFTEFFGSDERPGTIVANADDPIVVSTISEGSNVTWVAEEDAWPFDSLVCPRCHSQIEREAGEWWCRTGDLRRPTPLWRAQDGRLHGPGLAEPIDMKFPGDWVTSNAVFAIATAVEMGVPARAGLARIREVEDVDGRYGVHEMDGRRVRLIMIKNAASWWSSLRVGAGTDATVVLALESFGVKDLAPLWEVDVSALEGRAVIVTGQRRNDAAARLDVDGIPYISVPDPLDAIAAAPPGDVFIIANYTSFLELRRRLP